MSNLGDGIYERGFRQGFDRGYKQAKAEKRLTFIQITRNLLKKTSMSDKEISEIGNSILTPDEVGRLRNGEDLS